MDRFNTLLFLFLIVGVLKFNLLAYIYDIRVSKDGIDFFVLTFFKVYTLPFVNIDFVSIAKIWYPLIAFNFKNRPFQKAYFIRKKKAWFTKQLLVTPSDPELFALQLVSNNINIHPDKIE